jgi:hypothetical protein
MRRFEQSYRSIADAIELPGRENPKCSILELLLRWLNDKRNGRLLMILEYADDEDIFFPAPTAGVPGKCDEISAMEKVSPASSRYLPQSRQSAILIATQNKKVGLSLAGNKPENVIIVRRFGPKVSRLANFPKLGLFGSDFQASSSN